MPRLSPKLGAAAAAALAILSAAAAAEPSSFNLLPNPLELDGAFPGDYRNWAAVLAQVMLAETSGGPAADPTASPAVAALGSVLLATHARLAALASAGPDEASPLFPRFHVALDAAKLGSVFGHHDLKKDEDGDGDGHHDPKWDAHMGLDHPVPPGCEPMDMVATPNMTDHNHGDAAGDAAAADVAATADGGAGAVPPTRVVGAGHGPSVPVGGGRAGRPYTRLVPGGVSSKQPQPQPQLATPPQAPQPAPPRQGRALRQSHDHSTSVPGDTAHAGGHGGHDDCHSSTGHVSVHKLWTSKAFFNYAPCVLEESFHGLHARAAGLRFAPRLFEFMPTGLMAGLQALNVAPSLIYFAPMGLNVQPQAVNIQPGLIYIGPMGANVQPQGVNVQPIGTSVMPTGAQVSASKVLVAPTKKMVMPVKVLNSKVSGPVYAPMGLDLTPPGQGGHGGHHGGGGGGGDASSAMPGMSAEEHARMMGGGGGGGSDGAGGASSTEAVTMPGMEGMTPEEHAAAMARMAEGGGM